MSTPEPSGPVVEEAPAVPPVEVAQQVEEPPTVVTDVESTPEEVVDAEDKVEKAMEAPTKPTLLTKLFSSLRFDKKARVPKSPKKEKDQIPAKEASTEAAVAEVSAEAAETAPEVKDTEAAAPAVLPAAHDEKPKADIRALRVGRRLSARVGDLFKYKNNRQSEAVPSSLVAENPPKIETPNPVAPLDPEIQPTDVTPAIPATA